MRLLALLILLAGSLLALEARGQTLTVPSVTTVQLPPGCVPTLPAGGSTVVCQGTAPPTCPATPPVCPTQPLPGCAACTQPPAGPALSATPGALTYPSTTIGTAAPVQSVTVRNAGSGTITLGAPSKAGANPDDFTRSGSCSNGMALTGDASCTSNWTFVPGSSGARSATATQQSSVGPFTTALSGTGVAATPTLPATIDGLPVRDNGLITSDQQTYDLGFLAGYVDARKVEKGQSLTIYGYGGSGNFAGQAAITNDPNGTLTWRGVGGTMACQPGQWVLIRRTNQGGYYPDPARLKIYASAATALKKKKTVKK